MVIMSSFGSKLYVAASDVEFRATDVQEPAKVSLRFPEGAQWNTSLVAMLRSVKDGPESIGGELAEPDASEAGTISYCRAHPTTSHDWYRCFS